MTYNKQVVSLVAAFALLVLLAAFASAGSITSVEVNDVRVSDGTNTITRLSVDAGDTISVRIVYSAQEDATDVRIKAWITGENDVRTVRFDTVNGKTYSRTLQIRVPFEVDADEDLELNVIVESRSDGIMDSVTVPITVQRESYLVEVLDVNMESQVVAGEQLPIDVVLKNRGRHFSEDTFVRVKVPALGIEQRAYFGDLSPEDQADPDKEDTAERRIFLKIPSTAAAGVYTVEVEAYSDDSITTLTRKLVVVGASANSVVVSATQSKTFAVGEEATYSITLVNSGNRIRLYQISVTAPSGLDVKIEEPIVAVAAGNSKTVKLIASSQKAGKYDFTTNVYSDNELIKTQSFSATVEGKSIAGGVSTSGNNAAVLLTVVLAIVFVVLLVVLIVLLTRKPSKSEEFGESYY